MSEPKPESMVAQMERIWSSDRKNLYDAAPDLLAACQALVKVMHEINPPGSGFSSYDKHVQAAESAIARATGQGQPRTPPHTVDNEDWRLKH